MGLDEVGVDLDVEVFQDGWRDVQDLLGFGFAFGFAEACSCGIAIVRRLKSFVLGRSREELAAAPGPSCTKALALLGGARAEAREEGTGIEAGSTTAGAGPILAEDLALADALVRAVPLSLADAARGRRS